MQSYLEIQPLGKVNHASVPRLTQVYPEQRPKNQLPHHPYYRNPQTLYKPPMSIMRHTRKSQDFLLQNSNRARLVYN